MGIYLSWQISVVSCALVICPSLRAALLYNYKYIKKLGILDIKKKY